MSDKERKILPKWLDKLKKVKHIEIYIAIIFVVILFLIYSSSVKGNENTKENESSTNITVMHYIENLENDLEDILSNIGGVDNVKVMITLDITQLEVVDSNVSLNKFPNIKGVLITANGVGDTNVKLKILHAVEAVVDIQKSNIEILSSN